MPQPIRIQHVVDPKEQIFAETKQYIDGFHLLKADVLLVIYDPANQPDDVKMGSIIIPKASEHSNTLGEYEYQGKVGLVVKIGPLAFTVDDTHKWGRVPKIGEWAVVKAGNGFTFNIPGKVKAWKCQKVEDVLVEFITDQPDVVY